MHLSVSATCTTINGVITEALRTDARRHFQGAVKVISCKQ